MTRQILLAWLKLLGLDGDLALGRAQDVARAARCGPVGGGANLKIQASWL